MPDWLRPFATFFSALAGIGLVLSVASHLAAVLGIPGPLGDSTWLLHVGIFVVWVPAVLVARYATADFPNKDFWKAALRACPPWMRYVVYVCFVYALLNFAYFITTVPKQGGSGPMDPAQVRGFSGHWMAFYAAAMALLYSSTHVKARDAARRCPNGHVVGPLARFCDQCGQYITEPLPDGSGVHGSTGISGEPLD